MKTILFFLIFIAGINANSQCWSKISAGDYHTLAISVDGELWAWGANYDGELGDGTTINRTTPAFIHNASWLDVSAGLSHSLGLKNDGTLWAWGRNGTGQLGDGTDTDNHIVTQVGSSDNWMSIAAGANHSAAIKSDGTLWAWGSDEYGQLGDGGTNTAMLTPTQIGTETNWLKIYASEFNTFLIKTDGTLWGCGRNSYGGLGDGTTINKNVPVQIGTATNWASISAGKYFTVGIKTDGTLWAWGDNYYGQLGDGTNSGKTTPTQIGSATTWQIVECGAEHIVALKTDGTVMAWGNGQNGALGVSGGNYNIPTPVSLTNAQSISCGLLHSLVITNDNKLWATGTNVNNQFGNGTNASSTAFIEVDCPAFLGTRAISKNDFMIFPNPVNDILIIKSQSVFPFEKIVITDVTGKMVLEQTGNKAQIDVDHLPSGLYLLQLSSEKGKSITKFIKQ